MDFQRSNQDNNLSDQGGVRQKPNPGFQQNNHFHNNSVNFQSRGVSGFPHGFQNNQQHSGGGPVTHSKYKRSYEPYQFQPNFLKEEKRQQEKAIRNGNSFNDENNMSGGGNHHHNNTAPGEDRRKSGRKVIDWTSSTAYYLQQRRYQRENIDVPKLLPDPAYSLLMQSTMAYRTCPVSSVATKFVRSATNKYKCPVYKVSHLF